MLDTLPDLWPPLVNENPALVRRGRWTHAVMLLETGEDAWRVTIDAGRIAAERETWAVRDHDFAIRGPAEAWEKFWSAPPPPMHHDLHALVRTGKVRLEGDIDLMLANMLYLKLALETLRGRI